MNFHVLAAVLFLTTVPTSFGLNASVPNADDVDMDAIFRGLHLDFCNKKCSEPLVSAFKNILTMTNIYDNLDNLCMAYDEVQACTKKSFCFKNQVMTIITGGVEDLCKSDKQTYIKENKDCIKPKIDAVSQTCNSKCQFVEALAKYSHDSVVQTSFTVLETLGRLDGVCESFTCYIPCLSKSLDSKNCTVAGGVITAGILHPFFTVAEMMGKLTTNMQQIITAKVPNSCEALVSKKALNEFTGPTE